MGASPRIGALRIRSRFDVTNDPCDCSEKVFGHCSLHLAFSSFIECSLVDYSDLQWEYENLNITYYLHRTFFGIQCCRGYAASLLEESRNFGPGSAVDLSIR
jgi:hypothetical protein